MKTVKNLLSILLIAALLVGCAPVLQTQPSSTLNLAQIPTTMPQTKPQQTQPDGNDAPTTQPPVTEPPVTEPPVTEPPVTEPPVTEPPVTEPPATEPPATEPPATEPPATEPPATEPPATEPPATEPPATEPPATEPPATEPPATEPEYPRAPDFTVYDAEGNEVKLSDFIGQPVIVNFWASWCGPCLMELPHFESKYRKYGDQIQFLMVHMTAYDTVEAGKDVIEKRGYTFPVYFDTEASAARAYGVSAIPATYVINEEGCVVTSFVGSLSAKELQALIDQLLGVD